MDSIGKLILLIGLGLVLLGIMLMILARLPFFNNLGSLPGDIRIQGENFSCFVPIVSMILISIVLTIVLNIIIRIINRS